MRIATWNVNSVTARLPRLLDWLADEFSRGTWAIHRPGWYTTYHAEMQRPEASVILAGSDIANGWAGFMDGAIESGLRAGAQALRTLRS